MVPAHKSTKESDSSQTTLSSSLDSKNNQSSKAASAIPTTETESLQSLQIKKLFPEIDQNELTRLIIQSLSDLGYEESSRLLKKESGLELDSPLVNDFISFIKSGDLDKAESIIDDLDLIDNSESVKRRILFLIKREKFLEALYIQDDTHPALKILRNELNELTTIDDIRSLSSLLMDKESKTLQISNGWIGSNSEDSRYFLLNEISKYINPNEMIPKLRLFKLLQQAFEYQKFKNLYQFPDDHDKSTISLYEDMKSNRSNFPNSIIKTLKFHTDEVWYASFSHNGSRLATASQDSTIHLFDVDNDFKLLHVLKGDEKSVRYVSFSPDDTRLVTCGTGPKARIWNVETGEVEHILTFERVERIWSAEWYPNGECIVFGSPDKEIAIFNSFTGLLIHKWDAPVVNDMAITSNYKLIVATYDNSIDIWDLDTKVLIKTLEIGEKVSSVVASKENPNLILINTIPSVIQLWDWNSKILLNKYVGHKQERFVIRSCFGYDEKLVATGSEDGRVFIWNKEFSALLGAFDAHNGYNVNCVAWNPVHKSMLVTCGDDGNVKVWGPASKLKN